LLSTQRVEHCTLALLAHIHDIMVLNNWWNALIQLEEGKLEI